MVEQRLHGRHDDLLVGADQPRGAGLHSLRTLGGVAQDEQRRTEGGRLLLHATGICEHQRGSPDHVHEVGIAERWHQPHARAIRQQVAGDLRQFRVRVHHEDDLAIVARCQPPCRRADGAIGRAPAFAAMTGEQDQRTAELGDRIVRRRQRRDQPQRIDDGIAALQDLAGSKAFRKQRVRRLEGGRAMQGGELRDRAPVRLFRERHSAVAAAQAGLDMHDRNTRVGGRQRAGERGGGIALHHHHVRPEILDRRLHP